MSSRAAVSAADQSSTSRRSRTARCRGGRSWITARQVLGLFERAHHPVAVHVQLAPVALSQLAELRLVASPGGGDDRVLDAASGGGAGGAGVGH
jgi:hypothetical protein